MKPIKLCLLLIIVTCFTNKSYAQEAQIKNSVWYPRLYVTQKAAPARYEASIKPSDKMRFFQFPADVNYYFNSLTKNTSDNDIQNFDIDACLKVIQDLKKRMEVVQDENQALRYQLKLAHQNIW